MGNDLKTVKIADSSKLKENMRLEEQLIFVDSYTYPYIGLINRFRLSPSNNKTI